MALHRERYRPVPQCEADALYQYLVATYGFTGNYSSQLNDEDAVCP